MRDTTILQIFSLRALTDTMIELESGADDAADASGLLRKYVDIPGNMLTQRVRRKCVDFNLRTLLVSNARLSTALKAWPIQLYFGVLGLVLVCYSLITVHSSVQFCSLLSTFKIATRQKVVGSIVTVHTLDYHTTLPLHFPLACRRDAWPCNKNRWRVSFTTSLSTRLICWRLGVTQQ